jgi:hypothetical protein
MISARMRAGDAWSDACILNLSARGMLVRAAEAPQRGAYLELRRGPHVIVARVVWSRSDRFGVQTQDCISADGLILDSDGTPPAKPGERRAAPRSPEQRQEASRRRARSMEFGTFALLGLIGTLLVGGAVAKALGNPLAAVGAALSPN